MPTDFFIKTKDSLKRVAENIVKPINLEETAWTIKKKRNEYWIFDETDNTVTVIHRRGPLVIVNEVDNIIALGVAESLLENYGFESVKWLSVPDGDLKFTVPRHTSV